MRNIVVMIALAAFLFISVNAEAQIFGPNRNEVQQMINAALSGDTNSPGSVTANNSSEPADYTDISNVVSFNGILWAFVGFVLLVLVGIPTVFGIIALILFFVSRTTNDIKEDVRENGKKLDNTIGRVTDSYIHHSNENNRQATRNQDDDNRVDFLRDISTTVHESMKSGMAAAMDAARDARNA